MLVDSFKKLRTNLELNDTFKEAISRKHNSVRSVIENNGKLIEKTQLVGSLQKGTRIQPRETDDFDIDVLVILGGFNQWAVTGGVTPQAAMDYVHQSVDDSSRYSSMGVQQDHPTVTFEYADNVKVELIPAYRNNVGASPTGVPHLPIGRGYWIPSPEGAWIFADYDYEAEYISNQNKISGGLLIPAIKMLKAVKRVFFPGMKSFQLEIIATQILSETIASRRVKNLPLDDHCLLHDFFHNAGKYLTIPMRIPGSNSPTVQLDSVSAQVITNALDILDKHADYCHTLTTELNKKEAWKKVFDDLLPIS